MVEYDLIVCGGVGPHSVVEYGLIVCGGVGPHSVWWSRAS